MKHDVSLITNESVHFVDSEDPNGIPYRYWRQFLKCSDGRYTCGTGSTKEIAEQAAKAKRDIIENELLLSPMERLKRLAAQPYILDADQQMMLKLIVSVLESKG